MNHFIPTFPWVKIFLLQFPYCYYSTPPSPDILSLLRTSNIHPFHLLERHLLSIFLSFNLVNLITLFPFLLWDIILFVSAHFFIPFTNNHLFHILISFRSLFTLLVCTLFLIVFLSYSSFSFLRPTRFTKLDISNHSFQSVFGSIHNSSISEQFFLNIFQCQFSSNISTIFKVPLIETLLAITVDFST